MFGALRRSRCTPVQRNRPRPPNTGKRKSGGPSDALALRLCSEIAQGQVKLDPLPMVFYRLGPVREPSEGGLQVPL